MNGEQILKCTDTDEGMRCRRREKGGKREGEIMRGNHRGEGMEGTILTDRGKNIGDT